MKKVFKILLLLLSIVPMKEYMTAYDEAKGMDNRLWGFRFPKEDGTPAVDDQMFEKNG